MMAEQIIIISKSMVLLLRGGTGNVCNSNITTVHLIGAISPSLHYSTTNFRRHRVAMYEMLQIDAL